MTIQPVLRAQEPQLLKPVHPSACALPQEATTVRSPCTAPIEKGPQSNRDPAQPNKYILKNHLSLKKNYTVIYALSTVSFWLGTSPILILHAIHIVSWALGHASYFQDFSLAPYPYDTVCWGWRQVYPTTVQLAMMSVYLEGTINIRKYIALNIPLLKFLQA